MSDSFDLSKIPIRPPLAERAAALVELRRGVPLVFAADSGDLAVIAVDGLEVSALRDFIELGRTVKGECEVFLILTVERARHLYLPIGTQNFVGLTWLDGTPIDLQNYSKEVMAFASPFGASPQMPPKMILGKFSFAESQRLAAAMPLFIQAQILPAFLVVRRGCSTSKAWENLYHLPEAALLWDAGSAPNQTQGVKFVSRAQIPLHHQGMSESISADFFCFRPLNGATEQVAVVIGEPDLSRPALVRLHSSCMTGDLFGSMRCDCGEQLRSAIKRLAEAGGGVILYLQQEGRGIGIANKLRAYRLQARGVDTVDANFELGLAADLRDYSLAAATLRGLGITEVRLLSNNPAKVAALSELGIKVVERIGHSFPANPHNRAYLETKKHRSGHDLG
ncbi:MAG: GTP cyclohydrolase II [Candidatus Pacebacteria bacterium]|nr:GTP cyclohydrolase II [Candidatus Paceibacterota bacterium]